MDPLSSQGSLLDGTGVRVGGGSDVMTEAETGVTHFQDRGMNHKPTLEAGKSKETFCP